MSTPQFELFISSQGRLVRERDTLSPWRDHTSLSMAIKETPSMLASPATHCFCSSLLLQQRTAVCVAIQHTSEVHPSGFKSTENKDFATRFCQGATAGLRHQRDQAAPVPRHMVIIAERLQKYQNSETITPIIYSFCHLNLWVCSTSICLVWRYGRPSPQAEHGD